jgi:hypothetical protein
MLDHVVDLRVVRHHDENDFGILAGGDHRTARAHAVALRALAGVAADVVAVDLEALADHMLGHLHAHGAQSDHARALHRRGCHCNTSSTLD